MKNLLTPVFLSLAGYLICVVSFFWCMDTGGEFANWWAFGIGLHAVASLIFFRRKASIWLKAMYLLLPVPLGFFMSLFATLLTFSIAGSF